MSESPDHEELARLCASHILPNVSTVIQQGFPMLSPGVAMALLAEADRMQAELHAEFAAILAAGMSTADMRMLNAAKESGAYEKRDTLKGAFGDAIALVAARAVGRVLEDADTTLTVH